MPTDEKRREVAAELRYTGNDCLDGGGLLPTLKRVLGVEGSWRKVFARLADLIEPEERTCNNLGTYGGFECSMCGFKEEQLSEMECEPQDWCFCPNCGAKVKEADS